MNHEFYMKQALREAHKAAEANEVPVGAIVVLQNQIIGRGHNQVELLKDCTAHAEILAITAACNYLDSKYIEGATLYVTLEPCLMCSGALYWSKLAEVVWGTYDNKNGFQSKTQQSPFHPKTTYVGGIMQDECGALLKEFFKGKR